MIRYSFHRKNYLKKVPLIRQVSQLFIECLPFTFGVSSCARKIMTPACNTDKHSAVKVMIVYKFTIGLFIKVFVTHTAQCSKTALPPPKSPRSATVSARKLKLGLKRPYVTLIK